MPNKLHDCTFVICNATTLIILLYISVPDKGGVSGQKPNNAGFLTRQLN